MRLWSGLLGCLLVAGCASVPGPRGEPWLTDSEIVTSISSEPETIDPQKASFVSEAAIVGMVFESLLTYDPGSLQLRPAAARALPDVSPDGRVYTYRLRPGLVYSDGAPLTAADFASAWLRLCDPRTQAAFAFVAYPIAGCERWNQLDPNKESVDGLSEMRRDVGVRAVDQLTLEFRLAKPASHF